MVKKDTKAALDALFEDAKKELIEKAKKDQKIDQRDIFAAIPDAPENAEILDGLYTELADANIEITVGNEPVADGVPPIALGTEWTSEEDQEEIVLDEKVYMDDIADDSVRMYLREVGKIPRLNAEEELALSNQVVAGGTRAKDKMSEANMRLTGARAKSYGWRGWV